MIKILTAVLNANPLIGELTIGLFGLSWGFWVYLPMPTLDGGAAFRALPELVWGLLLALLGLAQLRYAIVRAIYGRRNRSKRGRIALVAVAVWVYLLASFAMYNITSTAVPIYFCISLVSAVVTVSLNGRHA